MDVRARPEGVVLVTTKRTRRLARGLSLVLAVPTLLTLTGCQGRLLNALGSLGGGYGGGLGGYGGGLWRKRVLLELERGAR